MKKFMKVVGIIIGSVVVLIIALTVIGASIANHQTDNALNHSTPVTAPAPSTTDSSSASSDNSSSDSTSSDAQTANDDTLLQGMLKAAPAPVVKKDDVSYDVTYTLTNNTKLTFDYVELDVDFFNKDGVKVDTGMVNTEHVAPGQKFQLDASTMNSDVASYKVVGIYSSALHN